MTEAERRADKAIAALAVPALGALVVEPLFLLADTAMVGHLGSAALAALAVAGTLLQTIVGVMVFLSYATTPGVARRLGAGDTAGALSSAISGIWLALVLGAVLLAVGLATARPLIGLFTSDPAVSARAEEYLTASLWGIPGMLIVFAGTGALRGLQDTRTTLVVAGAGFGANIALNAVLIYPAGLGILGSGIGTAAAQWGMAIAYCAILLRKAAARGARLHPDIRDIGGAAAASWWLFLRTVSLRVCVVATVWFAARIGPVETAGYQIVSTLFTAAAFALDSLAIAAQALLGKARGAEDGSELRLVTRRIIRMGWLAGIGIGVAAAAVSQVIGLAFTSDPAVLATLPSVILLMAAGLPVAGYAFVLDGVLIGVEDYRYLAFAMAVTVVVHLAALVAVLRLDLTGTPAALAIWGAYGIVFIGTRAALLGPRVTRRILLSSV